LRTASSRWMAASANLRVLVMRPLTTSEDVRKCGEGRNIERIIHSEMEQRWNKQVVQTDDRGNGENGRPCEAPHEGEQHDEGQIGKGRGREVEAQAEAHKGQQSQTNAPEQKLRG
jgi:hypothetical protein